jgi:hypothetical protein
MQYPHRGDMARSGGGAADGSPHAPALDPTPELESSLFCLSPSTDLVCRAKTPYDIHVESILGGRFSPPSATSRDLPLPTLSALEVMMVSNETALANIRAARGLRMITKSGQTPEVRFEPY